MPDYMNATALPAVIFLGIIGLIYLLGRLVSKSKKRSRPGMNSVTRGLRDRMLRARSSDGGIKVDAPSTPWGCLMEIGRDQGCATVVALIDGTGSLYIVPGGPAIADVAALPSPPRNASIEPSGGIIGGIAHESVRRAARAMVVCAVANAELMAKTDDFPFPMPGRIRFYLLSDDGVLFVEEDEQILGRCHHRLSPLFYAGQEVFNQLQLSLDRKPDFPCPIKPVPDSNP